MIDDFISIIIITILSLMLVFAGITISVVPISNDGCSNYQSIRSHFDNATAIGCEWNGTAWSFNVSKLKLSFDNDTVYLT